MESASLGGVVLDSTVLIAAERRGHSVREILEQVHASQGDVEVGISVVSIAELVHGAYRAKDAARQERRLQFIERLTSDVPVYPVSLEIAQLAGRIEGQQEAKGIHLPFGDLLIGATALHQTLQDSCAVYRLRRRHGVNLSFHRAKQRRRIA